MSVTHLSEVVGDESMSPAYPLLDIWDDTVGPSVLFRQIPSTRPLFTCPPGHDSDSGSRCLLLYAYLQGTLWPSRLPEGLGEEVPQSPRARCPTRYGKHGLLLIQRFDRQGAP